MKSLQAVRNLTVKIQYYRCLSPFLFSFCVTLRVLILFMFLKLLSTLTGFYTYVTDHWPSAGHLLFSVCEMHPAAQHSFSCKHTFNYQSKTSPHVTLRSVQFSYWTHSDSDLPLLWKQKDGTVSWKRCWWTERTEGNILLGPRKVTVCYTWVIYMMWWVVLSKWNVVLRLSEWDVE